MTVHCGYRATEKTNGTAEGSGSDERCRLSTEKMSWWAATEC